MIQEVKKITPVIQPFQNEEEVVIISKLTIENRLDRVSIYGSIDITRDKQGQEYLFELKRQIDAIMDQMENEELPERVETLEAREVNNPFA